TDFKTWLTNEQRRNTIELQLVHTVTGLPQFSCKHCFVCSRHGTGGVKVIEKKLPERARKIPSKLTSCQCSLVVKQYPNTTKLLGKYHDEHNHPLNATNLPFTWIQKETREFIAGRLHDRMSADAVVCTPVNQLFWNTANSVLKLDLVHSGAYKDHEQFNDASDDDNGDDSAGRMPLRTQLIQLRDIRQIEKAIKAEDRGHLLEFKSKADPPPALSNLAGDVFMLMFQTGWQCCMFRKFGNRILCIDATHNTT
ncbi:hypothetical protein DFH08DRAFT_638457, partial [Mycena albidolilacea]